MKSSVFSTETKFNDLDRLVNVHKRLIKTNSTAVENLRKDMKK